MVQQIITVSFLRKPLVFREILRAQWEDGTKPLLGASTPTYHIMLIPNIF